MPNQESKVESYLREQFRLRGGDTYKWVSPGRTGVPDQICIVKGLTFFIEVKQFDGEVSPMQLRELRKLDLLGAASFVVKGKSGVDKMMEFVDSILKGEELTPIKEVNKLLH